MRRQSLSMIVLVVMALHAFVLSLAWRAGSTRPSALDSMPRVSMVMVTPLPVPSQVVPPATPLRAFSPKVARAARAARAAADSRAIPPVRESARTPQDALSATPGMASAPKSEFTEAATTGPDAPNPATSLPAPLILDAENTRRAVQDPARQRTVAELARDKLKASERTASTTRDSPLAAGIGEAARGDCAKGDFKGGGMGLLSLPLLALAALQGECAR